MYIYLCPYQRLKSGQAIYLSRRTNQRGGISIFIKNGYADPFDPFVNGLTGCTQITMEVILWQTKN